MILDLFPFRLNSKRVTKAHQVVCMFSVEFFLQITASAEMVTTTTGETSLISPAESFCEYKNKLIYKEGVLHKWTNYLKGYRQRWFVLDSDGNFSYYRLGKL